MDVRTLIHQKNYEQVKYVLRRHPITFVPQLTLFLVLLALPILSYLMINSLFPNLLGGEIIYSFAVVFVSIYYLVIYIFFFAQFIDFYLDEWIITNDRIVDIEQLGLFSRSISELDLFRIQDITTDVKGFFATFFNYGNVSIKTASQNLDIVFYNVHNPNKVRHELLRLADVDRKFHFPEMTSDKVTNHM